MSVIDEQEVTSAPRGADPAAALSAALVPGAALAARQPPGAAAPAAPSEKEETISYVTVWSG